MIETINMIWTLEADELAGPSSYKLQVKTLSRSGNNIATTKIKTQKLPDHKEDMKL